MVLEKIEEIRAGRRKTEDGIWQLAVGSSVGSWHPDSYREAVGKNPDRKNEH